MKNYKTTEIISLLVLQWKKLGFVAIFSIIVGFIISSPMVIKPLYKSYAIVYPVNLSPNSEESNTEQLLQWFNSEEVKNAVARKFDLYNHYDIDTLSDKYHTYFNLKFKELVSINSTLYESIEISVKDQDPIMAKKIVQALIDETNHLIMSVKKERLKEYILNNQNELKRASLKVDSLKGMIDTIRSNFNLIDVGAQAKYLSKELIKNPNLSESNMKIAQGLKTQKTELDRLGSVIGSEIGTYNYFRNQIDGYMLDYENKISFTNVVSKPTLPDSKCYPVRSLIVAIITISSLLIASVIIVFFNLKKD